MKKFTIRTKTMAIVVIAAGGAGIGILLGVVSLFFFQFLGNGLDHQFPAGFGSFLFFSFGLIGYYFPEAVEAFLLFKYAPQ